MVFLIDLEGSMRTEDCDDDHHDGGEGVCHGVCMLVVVFC